MSFDMDTTLHQLKKYPSLRISRNSSNVSFRENSFLEDHHDLSYISLKDIISNSPTPTPTCYSTNLLEVNDFNSSTISIRNELVKRAASAYLQSAAILATRDQNYFVNFWGSVRYRAREYLRRNNVYERNPFRSCFQDVCRFVAHTVGVVWNRMIRTS